LDIAVESQLLILNNKMSLWQNTYYDAGLDAKIAEDIGNDKMTEIAAKRMKEALTAIGFLEREISQMEGGDKNE